MRILCFADSVTKIAEGRNLEGNRAHCTLIRQSDPRHWLVIIMGPLELSVAQFHIAWIHTKQGFLMERSRISQIVNDSSDVANHLNIVLMVNLYIKAI